MNFQKNISKLDKQTIYKIDGVGVDLNRFFPRTAKEKEIIRNEMGYKLDEFIIVNVAEINKNKNQIMLVKALPILIKTIRRIRVVFIGKDNDLQVKETVKKLSMECYVDFLGYRNDIDKLIAISNIAFSASFREGLPVNIIEAMACGIPVVCSKNRGHNSLIDDKKSGLLFSPNSQSEMINCLSSIYTNNDLAEQLLRCALNNSKKYAVEIAVQKMADIYKRFM
jgi:glycosyltransferase EpsD